MKIEVDSNTVILESPYDTIAIKFSDGSRVELRSDRVIYLFDANDECKARFSSQSMTLARF